MFSEVDAFRAPTLFTSNSLHKTSENCGRIGSHRSLVRLNNTRPTRNSLHMPDKTFGIGDALGLFFGGGVASWLITHLYYRKQKTDSAKDSRDLAVFLHVLWQQGGEIKNYVRKVDERLTSLSTMDRESQFAQLNKDLLEPALIRKPDDYLTTALAWKTVADQIAEERIASPTFKVLDPQGMLTLEGLIQAHRAMFPSEYKWAGTLRTTAIRIERTFRPVSNSQLAAMSSIGIQPIPPEDIPSALDRLLDRWNRNLVDLRTSNLASVADAVARFHQEFLLIHPFFDGNGRLSRLILREQMRCATGRDVRPFTEREGYLLALQAADAGATDQLRDLVISHAS